MGRSCFCFDFLDRFLPPPWLWNELGMIRAVIFDFNGVLVDDEHVHFELFREVLGRGRRRDRAREQYHERYLGLDDRGCFEAALVDAGQAADGSRLDDLIARKARRYVAVAAAGLRFFPDAAECLTTLAGCWPLAINSGACGRRSSSPSIGSIAATGSRPSSRPRTRPGASPIPRATCWPSMRSAGIPATARPLADLRPEHCVVVEDSLAGVASAKGAGMWAVGITHTYAAEALREAGADAIIDGLETLTPDWITGRFATVRV